MGGRQVGLDMITTTSSRTNAHASAKTPRPARQFALSADEEALHIEAIKKIKNNLWAS
jgi:hypothetical protein